MILFSAL